MKRITIPLDIQKDGILNKLPEEQLIKLAKEQLNYGWYFINLKHLENSAYDYSITVEWRKDSEPTVPPFDSNN